MSFGSSHLSAKNAFHQHSWVYCRHWEMYTPDGQLNRNSVKRKFEEQVIKSDSVFFVNTSNYYPWSRWDDLGFYGLNHFLQNDAGAVIESQNKRLQDSVCGLLFIYESDFKWKPQLFPCFSFMLQQRIWCYRFDLVCSFSFKVHTLSFPLEATVSLMY